MTLVVLEHPLSPYAQKVKLALAYKGISFDVEQPIGIVDGGLFRAASPRAEVPVLRHGDLSIYHSPVILSYIEETWPEPALLPASPRDRARVRLIEEAMDTHFEANTWALGEVLVFGRAEGDRAESLIAFARAQIEGWFRWLDSKLVGEPWFNGREYGWADLCVVPFVHGAVRLEIAPERESQLAGWLSRINEREDVRLVREAAQAAALDPQTMQAAIEQGFKREYRDHRLEWMARAGALEVVAAGLQADNIRFNDFFALRED